MVYTDGEGGHGVWNSRAWCLLSSAWSSHVEAMSLSTMWTAALLALTHCVDLVLQSFHRTLQCGVAHFVTTWSEFCARHSLYGVGRVCVCA